MSTYLSSVPFVLAVVTTALAATAAADETLPFKIMTKRDNDRVRVKADRDQAVFSIHSPSGISHASIERTSDKWPDAVVLRLHLKGLEKFRAVNDKVKLEAAVSSQDGKARIWTDGKEDKLLDAKSPYWMAIRAVGGDGKPAKVFPLKDGHFEMALPKAFFESNPKSITLNWIDFFRN